MFVDREFKGQDLQGLVEGARTGNWGIMGQK